jgi:fructose-bisphosphate aldolase, class II
MPHVSAREILEDGRKRGYGVGSLMGSDLEMTIGLVRAAEEVRAPLMLVFNRYVNPKIPEEYAIPMIVNAAVRSKAPIATILDHGYSLEECQRAIALGINTVMFDGSALPFEENVAKTREVVAYAHARGVCVEAELGSIAGSAVDYSASGPEAHFTDPDVAVDFVARTGIDELAISFGNSHGVYHGEPKLDLDRVQAIYQKVKIPLVMHGASGLEFYMYPKIIGAGITKVCYYTAMARSAMPEIVGCVGKVDEKSAYHDIVSCSVDYFYRSGKHLMTLFGSMCSAAESELAVLEGVVRETVNQVLSGSSQRDGLCCQNQCACKLNGKC